MIHCNCSNYFIYSCLALNYSKTLEILYKEIYRVLNENGQVIILEFSQPDKFPVKQLYGFYFKYILPNIGGLISGNKPAYKYLHDSVFAFPQSHDFLNIMNEAGFKNTWQKRVSFGIDRKSVV